MRVLFLTSRSALRRYYSEASSFPDYGYVVRHSRAFSTYLDINGPVTGQLNPSWDLRDLYVPISAYHNFLTSQHRSAPHRDQ